MDPLTIASTAAGLAAQCPGIIRALSSLPSAKDQRSEAQRFRTDPAYLKEDLNALARSLTAIDTVCRENHGTLTRHMGHRGTFWTNLEHRLDTCASTLRSLERVVQDFRRSDANARGLFRSRADAPRKQHLANLADQGRRVNYYVMALQESLQKINGIVALQDTKSDTRKGGQDQDADEFGEQAGSQTQVLQEALPPYSVQDTPPI